MLWACGAVEGAGLGASARSALIARAFDEMARMVSALGGSAATLTGLAGLGDLTLTCTSVQSRNYQFGMAWDAASQSRRSSPEGLGWAEGVATTPVAEALAKSLDVEAPLIGAVHAVLSGQADITTVVAGLMSRPLNARIDPVPLFVMIAKDKPGTGAQRTAHPAGASADLEAMGDQLVLAGALMGADGNPRDRCWCLSRRP